MKKLLISLVVLAAVLVPAAGAGARVAIDSHNHRGQVTSTEALWAGVCPGTYGTCVLFNTFDQTLIAAGLGAYVTARLGMGPYGAVFVSVAIGFITRHGICSQGRYLQVRVMPYQWVSCVSGLATTYPGGGGGGSWRGSW